MTLKLKGSGQQIKNRQRFRTSSCISVTRGRRSRWNFGRASNPWKSRRRSTNELQQLSAIRSGMKLLLNGAGGGVGTFALQMAKLYDVEVTVVDKAGKLDMLSAMGADHVVDYLKEDFTKSGRRYDLILDVPQASRAGCSTALM
jgi:hypothetical protein